MKREVKIFNKKNLIGVAVIIVLVFLAATFFERNTAASESIVYREFSKTKVDAGDQVTVTLDVSISEKDTFYAIEEYVPDGWKIIDSGGGDSSDSNVLMWVAFQGAEDTTYSYIVQAQEGADSFGGVYMFETFDSLKTTAGDNTIVVE